jgi:hypothetical protein
MSSQEEQSKPDCNINYTTIRQLAADPQFCFTAAMLRYYVLHAHKNGLSRAIRRLGKKVLIRKDLFIDWIEQQSYRG